jgi:hypothetical protein
MMMARFNLWDRVRRIAVQEVRAVEEIREVPGIEPTYSIQLGSDFVTRVWAKDSELELVPTGNRVMAVAADPRERHLPKKD